MIEGDPILYSFGNGENYLTEDEMKTLSMNDAVKLQDQREREDLRRQGLFKVPEPVDAYLDDEGNVIYC
ncbi:hypothetical protein HZB01_03380 [Candidatus Woesearchaeota archaeon]|nr:hypothetical protein [Candidatus Woesearchaeota archaeon]